MHDVRILKLGTGHFALVMNTCKATNEVDVQQLQRWGFAQIDSITAAQAVAPLRARRAHQNIDPGSLRRQSCSAGFTLIELMVTIAVAAILATIAVPAYTSFISGNRARAEMDAFVGSLLYARSAAVKHGQFATICASTYASASAGDPPKCSNTEPWDKGWIVFLGDDPTASIDVDDVVRVHEGIEDSLTGNGNVKHSITLNRFGRPVSNGFANGTITLVPDEGVKRCVVLSKTGKMHVESGGSC